MFADVAQQVEHFLGKEEASSSNLPISSKRKDNPIKSCLLVE